MRLSNGELNGCHQPPRLRAAVSGAIPDSSLETMTRRSRPVSIGIIIKSLLDGLTSDEEETRNIAPPGEHYYPLIQPCFVLTPALKKVVQAIPRDTAQLAQNVDAILKRTFQILDSVSRNDW
jgi:hypothetical protein